MQRGHDWFATAMVAGRLEWSHAQIGQLICMVSWYSRRITNRQQYICGPINQPCAFMWNSNTDDKQAGTQNPKVDIAVGAIIIRQEDMSFDTSTTLHLYLGCCGRLLSFESLSTSCFARGVDGSLENQKRHEKLRSFRHFSNHGDTRRICGQQRMVFCGCAFITPR